MKPKEFKESNKVLGKPESMTDDECGSLHIHNAEGQCISKWKAPLWDRVKFLFHGTVWIGILSGETQPPIWLDCKKTVFIKPKK